MADVSVQVPARPELVHVLRSVIASIAARAEFTYDQIDDLRLAVDEACAQLLASASGTMLTMVIGETDTGGIEILASVDSDGDSWPPSGIEHTLTWQVLAALADDARFELLDGHPALRLTKRRMPAGAR